MVASDRRRFIVGEKLRINVGEAFAVCLFKDYFKGIVFNRRFQKHYLGINNGFELYVKVVYRLQFIEIGIW